VRLTIVHALGKMTTRESAETLKKMRKDRDAGVRTDLLSPGIEIDQ